MLKKEHSIWVEKYRPQNLDTYIGNEHIIKKVKKYLETGDVPHLLFYGIQGTGKTTIAKIIINSIECDFLYINASDENSVEIIRTKIKNFASAVGFNDLKIIILDEADYLTPNAQAALRNIIETFSRHTRFILTCNYLERIIAPIQSRMQTFGVIPPSKSEVAKHLASILQKEEVEFDLKDIATLINANFPDIRKIINQAQMFCINGKLTIDEQSIIEANYLLKITEILKSKDSFDSSFKGIRQILADSKVTKFEDAFRYFYDSVESLTEDPIKQAGLIILIGEAQYEDAFVVDKEINIMKMFIQIIKELRRK